MRLPAPLRDLIAALLMVGLSFGAAAALDHLRTPAPCAHECRIVQG